VRAENSPPLPALTVFIINDLQNFMSSSACRARIDQAEPQLRIPSVHEVWHLFMRLRVFVNRATSELPITSPNADKKDFTSVN
jgi:hypothetical protein